MLMADSLQPISDWCIMRVSWAIC